MGAFTSCGRRSRAIETISYTEDVYEDSEVEHAMNQKIMAEQPDPNDFIFLNILGNGSYGKVVRVRSRKDPSKQYAMKMMDKRQIHNLHGKSHLKRVKRERKYLRELGCAHPFMVGMECEINTKNRVYLLLQLCPFGDLRGFLKDYGPCTANEAQLLIAELLLVTAKVHSHHLIHRDIRPLNILVNCGGHLCLADFGIACRVSSDTGSNMRFHTTYIGASTFTPPEMGNNSKYSYSIDYYSIGIVLYQLLSGGIHPFTPVVKKTHGNRKMSSRTLARTLNAFASKTNLKFRGDFDWTPEAVDLICNLVEEDPNSRLGWYDNPDLSKFVDSDPGTWVAEDLSEFHNDPMQQEAACPLPTEDIRSHPFFEGLDWLALARGELKTRLDLSRVKLPPVRDDEPAVYGSHLECLEEFNRRDPSALIAEAFR